jgi:hypothetical protein
MVIAIFVSLRQTDETVAEYHAEDRVHVAMAEGERTKKDGPGKYRVNASVRV